MRERKYNSGWGKYRFIKVQKRDKPNLWKLVNRKHLQTRKYRFVKLAADKLFFYRKQLQTSINRRPTEKAIFLS